MLKLLGFLAVAYIAYRIWVSLKNPKSAQRVGADRAPDIDIQSSKPVQGTIHLTYIDAEGKATKRVVTLISYQLGQPAGFSGYCHLRHETRTFRIDRVQQAIDNSTGEIIQDLPAWLEAQHRATPTGMAVTLKAIKPDHPPVLAHMAKADGAMRAPELEIIAQHLNTLVPGAALDGPATREILQHFPTTDFPAFQYHAGQIAKHSTQELQQMIHLASAIIGTQKTVHANETRALDYLKSLLPVGAQAGED